MKDIESQIRDLAIPYPQRHLLALEVKQDLELGMDGDGDEGMVFPAHVARDLYEVHATRLDRWLRPWGRRRKAVERMTAFIPLMTSAIFIFKEDRMVEFIREGGAGMYTIIVVGLFLLGKEALSFIRLVVVKDHSVENLRLDTSSVLLGCLALMFLALGWTTFGIYRSAEAVTQAHLPYELLIVGIKESLTPMVLSSLLAGLIVLAHYATRRVLRVWHAPLAD